MSVLDTVIYQSATSAAPKTYTISQSQQIIPLVITATIDGTSAAGPFLCTVELVSDAGVVMARCPCFTSIAAGGSAEVSWFRLKNGATSASSTLTAYEALVLSTPGIVLYWKLDDAVGSTTVADSFDSHTGTVFGTVTFGQPKLADVTSALFAGGMAGSKSNIPGIVGTQLMSLVCWIKTSSAAAVNTIAWGDTSAPNGRWFQLYTDNLGKVNFVFFGTDASGHSIASTASVNDGVRHSVMVTYTATTPSTGAGAVASIYIDGALDTSSSIAMGGFGLANTNAGMVIGARWRNAFDDPNGTAQFAGTLDEYAVFESAISASRVAAIDAAGRVT